jgi:hypothetical protein
MNKWQIICPVALMALFAVTLVPRAIKSQRSRVSEGIAFTTLSVAWDLETKTNSALLVSISPALKQALDEFLTTPGAYREALRRGDEPAPVGDGTATHRVYMGNVNDQYLALRLRYDQSLNKFHVVGFWQPKSWPDKP